ncbi:hypothetical protein ZWY2020_034929 [Hordeum vulgare]|nr:hypothetical protein ZWY2020_034929 [Hordeum vulgare]
MWYYTGPEDSTRTNPECVTGELVASWVLNITGACDNPRGAWRVKPFRADNPPPNEAWTNWFSPVSNGNPAEEEEGSQEGSVESVEYVSDSGETEEESEEEEGEDEEQNSPHPPPEPRTKRRHEPVAPSAPPAASSAPPAAPVVPSASPAAPVVPSAWSTKRTRDSAAELAGQPPKVAKPRGSKPRKALPRMRIAVSSPQQVIHVEDDDQKRSEQAAAPVLEAVPSVTTPAMDAPPTETMSSTETTLISAEPTGAGLGMPKESLVVPGPWTVQYDARRLPEDQLGASKEAMVHAGLMAGDAKRAYDSIASVYKRSLELRDDIRMQVLNRRCIAQEKYVSDWARHMIALLGDFCMDVEAEAADVERSIIPNVPLGDDANRDMLRAHIRLGKVGPFIGRLREVVGQIDKELWPEDESRQEMEGLMTRLEEVPNRVQAWKKSAARCGADVALSLVRVLCKEAREEKLKALQVTNTKKLRFEDFMETFPESATRIADGIDLDTFVEPASPSANPDDS